MQLLATQNYYNNQKIKRVKKKKVYRNLRKKKGAKHTEILDISESSCSEEESEYEDDDDYEFTNIQEPKDITDA